MPIEPIEECPECHGEGEVRFNISRDLDPQCDDTGTCGSCAGTGLTIPDRTI